MRSSAEETRWEKVFREVRFEGPRRDFLADLERRLREETAQGGGAMPSARRRLLRWGGLAAAAALLLAVGLTSTPPGDGEREPDRLRPQPAKAVIAVHATPPVHTRERDWSLMELVEESDVILAGRFVAGGHGNSFRVDGVLKGGDPGGVVSLLTQNGLRCPAPAVPRAGDFAVVFAVRENGKLAVPSRAWLRRFGDAESRNGFAEGIALRLGPAAADGIAEQIRAARRSAPDAPFVAIEELVRDIGVVGGVRGVVVLMELWLEFGEEDVNGSLLESLAEIRLHSADAPDLAAEIEKLRKELEAPRADLSSEERRRLLERLIELANVRMPDGPAPMRSERIEDAGALRDRLAAVNAALRRSVERDFAADPDGLRADAEAVRAALAREVALDDQRTAGQRAAAISVAVRQAPDALVAKEVGVLIADERLPYFLRSLAVKLAGRGRLSGAAPALFDLVAAEARPDNDGPEPRVVRYHGAVRWGLLRLQAIDALAKIGDPRSVRLLRDLREREYDDEAVERAVDRALRRIERRR